MHMHSHLYMPSLHIMYTCIMFFYILEPWKHKRKLKRRKTEVALRGGNFSIKPPPTSGGKGRGKTKTGFNSKSLKFEPGVCVCVCVCVCVPVHNVVLPCNIIYTCTLCTACRYVCICTLS